MTKPTIQDLAEIGRLVRLFQADAECITAEQPDLMQLSDQDLRSAIQLLTEYAES